MTKTALVLGASGGIGHALLEQCRADNEIGEIYATSTRPASPELLSDDVHWLQLDYTGPDWTQQLAALPAQLDLFICATGYLHDAQHQPEKNLGQLEQQQLQRCLLLNATGPMMAFAACARRLKASDQPTALILSAQVGSIADNQLGGWYGYRMAKAALNMGVKSASIEASRWRNNACIVAVHPGTTHSKLSEPFVRNRKQPVQSATLAGEQIYRLTRTLGPKDNGRFVNRDGSRLPW